MTSNGHTPTGIDPLPPNNLLAEQSVVGSILVDPDVLPVVQDTLKPGDFFYDQHRWIFETCVSLARRKATIDLVTVARDLEERERLAGVGGLAYLGAVIGETPTSLHVEHYVRLVKKCAQQRKLVEAGARLVSAAYKGDTDLAALATTAANWLLDTIGEETDAYLHTFEEAVQAVVERLVDPSIRPPIPTDLLDLDAILGGFQRGELHLIGGRPGMAKSALGLHLALAAARGGRRPILFSMEMSHIEVGSRVISGMAELDSKRLRPNVISAAEHARVMDGLDLLFPLDGLIDDRPYVSLDDVRLRLRRQQHDQRIDMVVIDYVGLMDLQNDRAPRHEAVAKVTRGLKIMAREFDVAMVALVQLNRDAEKQDLPTIGNLRDSGALEQDADVVLLLHRDEERYTEAQWGKKYPGQPYPRGVVDLILAKNRHGPTAHLKLFYEAAYTRFRPLAGEELAATGPIQDEMTDW